MVIKSIPLQKAQRDVADIFSITGLNENGKPIMRCSRCEGMAEKDRGKSFQLLTTAVTKAKEHIAVYCPEVRPSESVYDASLRHTLLIHMSEKQVACMSKAGQALRKSSSPLLRIATFIL